MEKKCIKLLILLFLLLVPTACHNKIRTTIRHKFHPIEEGRVVIDLQDLFPKNTIDSIFFIRHGPLPDTLIGEIIGIRNYRGYGFFDLQDDMQRIVILSSGRVLYQENIYDSNNISYRGLSDTALLCTQFIIEKTFDEDGRPYYRVCQ